MAFNINISEIATFNANEDPILPFITSFIDSINYHGAMVDFDLDRITPLAGDRAGLFEGVVHQWDGLEEKLSLNFTLDTAYFDFRSYADDLSFSNDADDAVIFSGNVLSFSLSRAWPVEIAFELFSAIRYNSLNTSTFFPILFIDAPLLNTERLSFGLRFGTLNMMEEFTWKEFIESERSYFFSIPFSIDDDEMSIGMYFQKDGVYYNLFNENYIQNHDMDSIAVFFDADLNFDYFNLNINTFLNFDNERLSFLEENSYFDFALSFRVGNIDFLMGARKQNLFASDDFFETSDFYLGLGAQTGSIITQFQIRYRNGHPEIGFSSSLAFIDIDNNVYETRGGDDLFNLQFDLGIENYFTEGLFFHIAPILTFSDEITFALRIPLYLELTDGKAQLTSLKADPWFDMWQNNSTVNDIYDSLTDMFALIERIQIGENDTSLFYIDASREETRNDVFFENYASFDALSLNTGFNFHNLDFGLYIDDLETPRLIDPYFSFYPIDYTNFSFSISVPTELLLENSRTFKIRSFLGFTYTQPFLEEKLQFSFFLYGESYAEYEDGTPVRTEVIYDFENMELYGYLLGGEIRWKENTYSLALNGGIHSGSIYPNYFNAFSSLNPDIDRTGYDIEGMSYYLIAEASLSFENVDFLFKYSMPNIVSLIEDREKYEGDMLTLDLEFTLFNGVGMHVRLSKLNFISSLEQISDFDAYFNSEDTIYSASITKDFDDMSLEVELGTVAIYEESRYMNSYKLKDVSPRLKINARIGF